MNKKWRYVLICFLVFWVCIKLFQSYFHKTYTKEEIDGFFEPITTKYGIKIIYDINEDFLSGLENQAIYARPAQQREIEPIRHRVLVRYSDILHRAFKRYPDHVIQMYLKTIYFAGGITVNGFEFGGLYDPSKQSLYVVDGGWLKDDRPTYVVHHELSSLFLTQHLNSIGQWANHNPNNYQYSYEITDNALKTYNSTSSVGTAADHANGFMNTYGQTSIENDFNEYSAMIFTYPQKFKEIMNQYPLVRGKFLVWLEFYQKIDPIFTEEYLFGPQTHTDKTRVQ